MNREEIIEKLNRAKTEKAALLTGLELNKNNPYWYEDFNSSFEAIEKRIAELEAQL